MALANALSLATASRANILQSITFKPSSKETPGGRNRAIRQALGLREAGGGDVKGIPKFACPRVTILCKRIHHIATELLPVTNLNEVQHAWQSGAIIHDIEEVMNDFGEIWSDSLAERDRAANPGTRLYVAGEVENCRDDLFWEVSKHRKL
jgi:hypothetical protein